MNHNHNNIFVNKIATRSDEIVYRMISPEKPDPTAVFVPDNKDFFYLILKNKTTWTINYESSILEN